MSLLDNLDAPQTPAVAAKPAMESAKIAAALDRIAKAGFTITLHPGDKLVVSPRAKLTEAQVAWITANKPAILTYLQAQTQNSDVKAIQTEFKATIQSVTIGTPPEPKKPPESLLVTCGTCLHGSRQLPGDELGAWRLCEVGMGGFFALAKRKCESFSPGLSTGGRG